MPPPLPLILFLFSFFPVAVISLNQNGLFLQRVKVGLSDPTDSLSSWNPRDPTPCNWYGVVCNNDSGHVTSFDLSNALLAGTFPTFFCRISTLTSLSLFKNSINDGPFVTY
ncbi:Receptor-like protein kinase HSL1 [Linum perenne]